MNRFDYLREELEDCKQCTPTLCRKHEQKFRDEVGDTVTNALIKKSMSLKENQ